MTEYLNKVNTKFDGDVLIINLPERPCDGDESDRYETVDVKINLI